MRAAGRTRYRADGIEEIAQAEFRIRRQGDVDGREFADLRRIAAEVHDLRAGGLERTAHFLELDERIHAGVEQHVGIRDGGMRERVRSRERRMVAMNRRGLRRAAILEQNRRLQTFRQRR